MNHKNLLLILFFCLFLTPFVANGETVGGYFQIDVNVLRDSDNNPISLNNIALYIDEQPTYPDFFTGETIYEGYSYTSLYQELTVGQSYTLGFGNMSSKHVRADETLAGIMVRNNGSSTNCTTGCASWGFGCDDYEQQMLVAHITQAEMKRVSSSYSSSYTTYTSGRSGAPYVWLSRYSNGYCFADSTPSRYWLTIAPADLSLVTCTSSDTYKDCPYRADGFVKNRICACGGWRIIVTI
ncbi:MAG: hypothetical protein PHI45_02930 [Candidatus Pacebacteria bacterium]|nr:hypothetical protein [Candidatus Paceibacterota bacterium]MDD5753008.1 hypothetical protein [Candidatus Paceibacterota bacterium]